MQNNDQYGGYVPPQPPLSSDPPQYIADPNNPQEPPSYTQPPVYTQPPGYTQPPLYTQPTYTYPQEYPNAAYVLKIFVCFSYAFLTTQL